MPKRATGTIMTGIGLDRDHPMGKAATRTWQNRTITVDFHDETTYSHLLGDGKAFLECVLAFLLSIGF